jgi:hypothetical protein
MLNTLPVLPSLVKSNPALPLPTFVKVPATALASRQVTATPKVRMLNDTGVTWGGNAQTGNNTTCTGAVISAQDCSHGRDAKAVAGTLTSRV